MKKVLKNALKKNSDLISLLEMLMVSQRDFFLSTLCTIMMEKRYPTTRM